MHACAKCQWRKHGRLIDGQGSKDQPAARDAGGSTCVKNAVAAHGELKPLPTGQVANAGARCPANSKTNSPAARPHQHAAITRAK